MPVLTVRPSAARLRRRYLAPFVLTMALPVIGVLLVQLRPGRGGVTTGSVVLPALAAGGAVLAAELAAALAVLRGRRLEISDDEVEVRRFGRRRRLRRAEVAEVRLRVAGGEGGGARYVLFLDGDGRVLCRLREEVWREQDLEAACRAVGVDLRALAWVALSPSRLESETPGGQAAWRRHGLTALVAAAAALTLAVAAAALAAGRI